MLFRSLLALILVIILANKSKAQVDSERITEPIIESISETANEDFDYSELLERLNFRLNNPLNINVATRENLEELFFLTPIQIANLLEYRVQNGKFISLLELQSVESLDAETLSKLLPFIRLSEANPLEDLNFKSAVKNGSSDVLFTFGKVLERQSGYEKPADPSKSYYTGNSSRFLTRYRYHLGANFSASLTMEKDAGEQFSLGSKNRGFDFYSGNIAYKSDGRLQKIVVGDYSLQFGQGLTLWTGLSFGKGAAVATITKNNIGLKPYSSTNELLFLRGISASYRLGNMVATPFVSYRFLDAGIDETGSGRQISSLSQTGLHRTITELENKSSVSQTVYGANIQYSIKNIRLGATAYQTIYSLPVARGDAEYEAFEFSGNKLNNVGAYYNYNWRNLYVFGEFAKSINSGSAFLNGLMISLSQKVSLVAFHRDYQKNYQSFFNQAVAESAAVNEKGFYSGIIVSPSRKIEWTMYADYFRFPWLRFRVDAPSSGYEILSQLSYSPSKRMKAILRYKIENKEENYNLDNTSNYLEQVRKQNYRVELNYKVNEYLELRNRLELVDYQKAETHELGSLITQDLIYNPLQSRFSGNMRFALFDTPGFNSRIYAFENDLLYSYSFPAFQNKGARYYINCRYKVNKHADLSFRYAISSYYNLTSIGAGLDKIEGDKKSDIKFQLRFQF